MLSGHFLPCLRRHAELNTGSNFPIAGSGSFLPSFNRQNIPGTLYNPDEFHVPRRIFDGAPKGISKGQIGKLAPIPERKIQQRLFGGYGKRQN
ncbi:hypothetical protein Bwad001_24530 [Bilophila wadsworthia]|jgi:hypothetical protein